MTVIECVPNVSEGRRQTVLDAFAASVRATPGLALLDYSGDASHNRSVFTFAGAPRAVVDGLLALAALAISEIDLCQQRGVHPRIGAIDVVPFVPLGTTSMDVCVSIAREVASTLADRHRLPIYLYEEASLHPNRRRLEEIRRGGFEGLAQKLNAPGWAPDFGPRIPHPTAGATVVGARQILVAYNINLATDRVDIARRIASRIRERDGGLPRVKALGLWLPTRGLAQVSMNLTDYRQTPPREVFDAVSALARDEGVEVLESELIGLIPAAALEGTSAERLRLRRFSDEQVLEVQLKRNGL